MNVQKESFVATGKINPQTDTVLDTNVSWGPIIKHHQTELMVSDELRRFKFQKSSIQLNCIGSIFRYSECNGKNIALVLICEFAMRQFAHVELFCVSMSSMVWSDTELRFQHLPLLFLLFPKGGSIEESFAKGCFLTHGTIASNLTNKSDVWQSWTNDVLWCHGPVLFVELWIACHEGISIVPWHKPWVTQHRLYSVQMPWDVAVSQHKQLLTSGFEPAPVVKLLTSRSVHGFDKK